MARIISDYNNYVPKNTSAQTLHSGAGKVHAVIATTTGTVESVTLYDNTAASGNVLIALDLRNDTPLILIYPAERPLRFYTGLTVKTSTNAQCHLITEA
jgi:hypothetical protein